MKTNLEFVDLTAGRLRLKWKFRLLTTSKYQYVHSTYIHELLVALHTSRVLRVQFFIMAFFGMDMANGT